MTQAVNNSRLILLSFISFLCFSCVGLSPDEKLVMESARVFQAREAVTLLAKFEYRRCFLSNGKYCQIQAVRGFTELIPFASYFTTDALVSEVINPQDSSVVYPWRVTTNIPKDDLKHYYHSYRVSVHPSIYDLYNLIKQYSPLEPNRVRDYSYSITGKRDYTGTSSYIVVSFTSKSKRNMKKVHMFGKGKLYIKNGVPLAMEIEDAEVRPSTGFDQPVRTLLTPYVLRISFKDSIIGLYPDKLSLSVRWELPRQEDSPCYAIEDNPIRNPFKYGASSETVIEFSDCKEAHSSIRLLSDNPAKGVFSFYSDSVETAHWKTVFGEDFAQILKDLGLSEEQLTAQSLYVSRRFKETVEKSINIDMDQYLSKTRNTYDELFK